MQMNPQNDYLLCEYFQILVGGNEMSKMPDYMSDSFTYLYVYCFSFFLLWVLGIMSSCPAYVGRDLFVRRINSKNAKQTNGHCIPFFLPYLNCKQYIL